MNHSVEYVDAIITLVLKEVDEREKAAGYSGSWSDNGSQYTRDMVEYYRMGQAGMIPPEWEKFVNQVKKNEDPEYQEFLRLQKKFQ